VNHRVHPTEAIHLLGDSAGLLEVGQVAGNRFGATVEQVTDSPQAVLASDVDDHVVAGIEQRLRCRTSEAVSRAGDEDACDEGQESTDSRRFKVHAGASTFEVYDSGGQFRWRAKSRNGQTTASSGEPFPSESNARRAADNVRDNAGSADGP
jgi:uncharacterized protein YegP (UPF0339 family)